MKFINNAGLILESDDAIKIECYKAQGLQVWEEPQPQQEDLEVADDYTIKKKPAKKKTTK